MLPNPKNRSCTQAQARGFRLYLTPMHAEVGLIKSMIANVHAAIQHVKAAAEQLPKLDPW
jgi:hypothetical protein